MAKTVKSEETAAYIVPPALDDDLVIAAALAIIEKRMKAKRISDDAIDGPNSAMTLVRLMLAEEEREVFAVLYFDSRHRLMAVDKLFYGTLDSATVHPREVVKAALAKNAAAVVFAHNHPSGNPEPSSADIAITRKLSEALDLVGVRVLDHIVVGESSAVSLATRGLM